MQSNEQFFVWYNIKGFPKIDVYYVNLLFDLLYMFDLYMLTYLFAFQFLLQWRQCDAVLLPLNVDWTCLLYWAHIYDYVITRKGQQNGVCTVHK